MTQLTDAAAAKRQTRNATWIYLVVTALSAACGLIVEIVAGRMIAPYLGMSLYTWTAIIAVVLAGFSLGHWIGGRLAEQPAYQAAHAVAWSLLLAAATAAASLILIRVLSGPVIALGLSAVPTILIITTALFFLPSVFVGIPSPVLTKLAIDADAFRLGHILGAFYAAGAIGSIVGTLAAGFIFISWLGTINTILLVSAIYLALSIIMFIDTAQTADSAPNANRRSPTAATFITPVLVGVSGATLLLAAGNNVRAFTSNCDAESDYYCIRVVDASASFGTPARVLVLDHLGHGVNLRDAPRALVSGYVEAQDRIIDLHLAGRPMRAAFFIGGGAYTLPRAWGEKHPDAELVVAEIDPAVTHVSEHQLWLDTSAKTLKVLHQDARRALAAETGPPRYDVIVGDAFHDIAVPKHLVSLEFYALIRERLKADGVYVMNVVDSAANPRLVMSVAQTLQKAFTVVEIWHSNEADRRATFVIAASTQPTPKGLMGSRLQSGLAWQRLSENQVNELSARLSPVTLSDDYAPVDRLIGVE